MSRKVFKYSAVIASLLLTAVFAGCGTSNKEGGVAGGDVAKVGDTACFQCHSATLDPLTGESIVAQYTRSAHYASGEGCESCHGGGAQHNGIGPIPFPKPDAALCATCHDGAEAPLTSATNFADSNHANAYGASEATEAKCNRCHSHEGAVLSNPTGFTGDKSIINNTSYQPVLNRDPETFGNVRCATCHEHGGALRAAATRDAATGAIVAWDPNKNFKNDQFDLCTSCHTYYKGDGRTLAASGNILAIAKPAGGFQNVSTASFYHDTAWYRTIATTHYDQPASGTAAAGGTTIEGYILRTNGKNPCFDCHGHEFKTNTRALADKPERPTTTYTDWAQSAHAGRLLQVKNAAAQANGGTTKSKAQVDAVMTAGATDASGVAWTHYDWDKTLKADGTSDRGDCQRCHTSTGASNYLSNPSTYDYKNNDFSHLSGWKKAGTGTATTSSGQNELLYCWGCHSNAGKGVLRNPGSQTFSFSNGATVTYPDVAGSNVCVACHSGRETGDSIKGSTADGTNLSFINSHYLAAGGQLFAKTGYTYTGLSYANPSFFKHDQIGTSGAPGTGSNGPCVGCHMTSDNEHLFTNVTKDGSGVITAITAKVCAACHSGAYALTPEKLAGEEEEYQAALKALEAALYAKGISYNGSAYPYFYVAGTTTAYKTWASVWPSANWRDSMGAAFNMNLLSRDPGGYAHNRFYSKRLIWDSIDFMNDGVVGNVTSMNGVIDSLVGTILDSTTATAAKTYLGDTRP